MTSLEVNLILALGAVFLLWQEMTNGAHGEGFVDQTLLSNFQHIEYLRAFLNNRLGWSRLDFMLCTSGAYMLYRRDVLVELGGFSRDFSCEDIELTFRAHERFLREGRPYRIVALPDLVAKTEGPSTLGALIAQRVRWQRILLETMWRYRRMLFNPRYRGVGILGAPFCLVSEVLAPFVEVAAIAGVVLAAFLDLVDWPLYLLARARRLSAVARLGPRPWRRGVLPQPPRVGQVRAQPAGGDCRPRVTVKLNSSLR